MMANLIDFLPDATFAINSENTVISWNRMMEKLTGMPASAILGTGNYAQVLSQFNEKRVPLVDLVLTGDKGQAAADRNLIRDGKAIISEFYSPTVYLGRGAHLWLIASPLCDTGGNTIGVIESIRDITRHKEAEEKLRATHEELNAAYGALPQPRRNCGRTIMSSRKASRTCSGARNGYRNVVRRPDGIYLPVFTGRLAHFRKRGILPVFREEP